MSDHVTWHADRPMLAAYQAGELSPATAASVESHLAACATCRSGLATMAEPARLASNWAAIEDRLDEGRQPLLERLLVRIGVREHHAQLVVVTPELRGPTIGAVVVLLGLVVLPALSGDASRDGGFYLFLVLAPLLPLAGVAVAFGGLNDPVHELTTAAPASAFELLLARVLAIVATTTILSAVASIPLPNSWAAATWLLPALGLSAASLALSTWVPSHLAAAGLGTAWVTAAFVSWRVNQFDPEVVERFVALRPLGQVVFALIATGGAVVLVLRRETLEFRRSP